jgi:hypothetical protein
MTGEPLDGSSLELLGGDLGGVPSGGRQADFRGEAWRAGVADAWFQRPRCLLGLLGNPLVTAALQGAYDRGFAAGMRTLRHFADGRKN